MQKQIKSLLPHGSAIKIDEDQIINSTGAISLQNVLVKMAVIGGSIIGFEVSSLWSRLGSEVTVVDFLFSIGVLALMRNICALSPFYLSIFCGSLSLSRTGYSDVIPIIFDGVRTRELKLELSTKGLSVEKDEKMVVMTETTKGGKKIRYVVFNSLSPAAQRGHNRDSVSSRPILYSSCLIAILCRAYTKMPQL